MASIELINIRHAEKTISLTLLLLIKAALSVVGALNGLSGLCDSALSLLGDGLGILVIKLEGDSPQNGQIRTHMRFIPLSERCGINLNDSTLHQCVRADEFIVRGVINLRGKNNDFNKPFKLVKIRSRRSTYHTDEPGLAGDVLRSPSKVASIETEGTVLHISATNTDGVDTLGTKLGAGGLPTKLKFSLFAVVGALSTSLRAFVAG